MRFLLIDQITAYAPENFIKGIKNITMSEDFLEFHFPKNPVMPGVMLLIGATAVFFTVRSRNRRLAAQKQEGSG